jgi:hypothetical protein
VVDPEGAPVAGQQLSITRTDLEPTETVIVETNSAGYYFAVFPLVANLVVEPIGSTYALEPSDGRPQPVQTHGGFVVNFTAYPRPDETLAITRSNAIQLVSTLDGSTQAANIVSGVGAVWSTVRVKAFLSFTTEWWVGDGAPPSPAQRREREGRERGGRGRGVPREPWLTHSRAHAPSGAWSASTNPMSGHK